MIGLSSEPERLACSRAGCSVTADFRIEWRNPKIHSADRVKVWLACAEHREYLENFLSSRDFPVNVVQLSPEDAP
ncbi:hypothetical protein D9V28_05155 [Mycetocola zhadangensis]|uniref:Acetone carboxylase n=1 Tax=Mycetocola zhadangensis TaxID=1164595 RepID=A0A3L7J731_9MICO|nr:hypothetical protein [Mycetocola zhadangensis]RLQ86224.1 hypothetical protein D9V28_05155 [Mycetocola zhadangensis]